MEKGQGRHGLATVFPGELLTVGAVPADLAVTDVVIAVNLFFSFENHGIHGIEEIECPFDSLRAKEPEHIVGTAVNAFFGRQVHATWEAQNGVEHVFSGGPELGIMVSQRHGPGNAAIGQELEDFQGTLPIGLAKEDISGVDHQIGPNPIQCFLYTVQGPPRQGVAYDVVGIGKLQQGKAAVGAETEVVGHAQRRLIVRLRQGRCQQRLSRYTCRHKRGTFEKRPAVHRRAKER